MQPSCQVPLWIYKEIDSDEEDNDFEVSIDFSELDIETALVR